MPGTPSLTKLLRSQAAALAFAPAWQTAADTPLARGWHNWIGWYRPDTRHGIELIDQTNYAAARELLRARLMRAHRPAYVIYCDKLPCPPSLSTTLQSHGIGVVHSPLPAKTVYRSLLATLAADLEVVQVHGVFLRVQTLGVLITGQSGTGKSSLALELIGRGHALVADDVCQFYRMPQAQQLHGICPPLLHDLLHVEELGVLNIAKLYSSAATLACHALHLVIELVDGHRPGTAQYMQVQPYHYPLLGLRIAQYKIQPRLTESMALLVETAVKNQLLYRDGYDANTDLAQRQQQLFV